jgi:hypothetical protein
MSGAESFSETPTGVVAEVGRCASTDFFTDCDCTCGKGADVQHSMNCTWPTCGCPCLPGCAGCRQADLLLPASTTDADASPEAPVFGSVPAVKETR